MAKTKALTPTELYAEGADHHFGLSSERAKDLLDIIEAVARDRGETRPPRVEWLKRVALGTPGD